MIDRPDVVKIVISRYWHHLMPQLLPSPISYFLQRPRLGGAALAKAQALVGKLRRLGGLVEGEITLRHDQVEGGCPAVDAQAAFGGADGGLVIARLVGRLSLAD